MQEMTRTRSAPSACPFHRSKASVRRRSAVKPNGCAAPGPRGLPFLGSLLDMRRDVLGLMMQSAEQYGDVSRHRLGPTEIFLISHPDHVKYVLKNHGIYDKNIMAMRMVSKVTGNSLLTSNGECWHRQRQLMQPAFSRPAEHAETMQRHAAAIAARWQRLAENEDAVDVASEMMRVTYSIAEKALFCSEAGEAPLQLEHAMAEVMRHTYCRIERGFAIPDFIPTTGNRAYKRALQELNRRVMDIIQQMRARQDRPDCLLSNLMATGMSEVELRNQVITLLVAGHETTANGLTWFWHSLAQHPAVQQRLHEELDEHLDGRAPTLADLDKLEYCAATIKEVMRLFPPVWGFVRNVTEDDVIGGFRIPAGSQVVISPYVLHRDPRFWENPETFDPERFLGARIRQVRPYAYIPYGGGPRVCIGQRFAMQEALFIAATLAQNVAVRQVPGVAVELDPGLMLRPKGGLHLQLRQRLLRQQTH